MQERANGPTPSQPGAKPQVNAAYAGEGQRHDPITAWGEAPGQRRLCRRGPTARPHRSLGRSPRSTPPMQERPNGTTPSQPGAKPQVNAAYAGEGQQPGPIAAWGEAPGQRRLCRRGPTARPHHSLGRSPRSTPPMQERANSPAPSQPGAKPQVNAAYAGEGQRHDPITAWGEAPGQRRLRTRGPTARPHHSLGRNPRSTPPTQERANGTTYTQGGKGPRREGDTLPPNPPEWTTLQPVEPCNPGDTLTLNCNAMKSLRQN